MKAFVVVISLLVCSQAFAGFGGSRSSGFSRSYGSRSSFGGSRSTYRAPIIRSAPVYRSAPRTIVRENTTVIHHDGGPGFLSGMIMGHMMSQPAVAQPQVVVVPEANVAPQAQAQAPAPVQVVAPPQEDEGSHWFLWSMLIGAAIIITASFFYSQRYA